MQDYELLVVMCQQWYELLYLNAIEGWRDRCRTVVCWLDEVYAGNIPNYGSWLHVLQKFDHIFLPYEMSANVLEKTIGRPCHYLPRAIDVIRFSPHPHEPARVIDVLSIGRRWEGIHEALLDWSRTGEVFYIHDTVSDGGDQRLSNIAQHRTMLANMIKRSLCFMVAPGKMQDVQETHGQMEIGMRYYEGAAGGAILIGEAPNTESFRNLFGWPQAVIPLQSEGSDVKEVVRGLRSETERARAISHRNAASVAARHDWMHRWQKILEIAGMEASPKLASRELQLKERAEAVHMFG
jgi:spore maturation protein CgeB